ncbi:MAG: hypothetical protein K2F90_00150 [Clostridiales bacterium]|nr:hypothetical protein [Clostridiales bacterium]
METFKEFLDRINSFQKKELNLGDNDFAVSQSVAHKVNADNTFKSFYGDTVVFDLDDSVKSKLGEYVDMLYRAAPQCFCDRLIPHTFHVTLHDLSNSPTLSEVAEQTFCNELKILQIKSELQKLNQAPIKLKSTYVFNMVNTSLVLGLRPVTQKDYDAIMALYSLIDGVKTLPYPFTPHITLAYYNANGFDRNAAISLENAVNEINAKLDVELSLSKLYYQKFTSMNNYVDVVSLLKK